MEKGSAGEMPTTSKNKEHVKSFIASRQYPDEGGIKWRLKCQNSVLVNSKNNLDVSRASGKHKVRLQC